MKKHIVSLLLVFTMICSLLPTIAIAAGESLNVQESNEGGEKLVVVTYVVPNAVNVTSIQLNVKFDTSKLEARDINWPSIPGFGTPIGSNATETNANGYFACSWSVADNTMTPANLNLVTAKFAIKSGASGPADFTITDLVIADENTDDRIAESGATQTGAAYIIPKAPISNVSFTLTNPVKGAALPSLSGLGSGYTGAVEWYEGTGATGTAAIGNAKPNQVYTAKITLTTGSGESFADSVSIPAGYTKDSNSTSTELVLTKTFDATHNKALTGLTVTTSPSKATYVHGETLDTTGMVVKATYDEGPEDTNFTDYTVAYETPGKNYLCKGNTKVTLKAEGQTVDVGLTVNAKELTVDGLTAVDREYKPGDTSVTLTGGTLNGVVLGETVTLGALPTGSIMSANVGNGKDVTFTALTLSGTDASNYTLTQPTEIKVNITRKDISGATINMTSASLPYTGSEQTVSIASVTLTGWTITAGDYDIVGNSDKATNVGSTTLTIQGKGNYTGTATTTWKITAIDPVLANFDVTPTLPAAQTYDGAHKTVTVVPKSGVNGMGTVKVYYEATAGITYPKSETAPTDMGTYKVTASVAAGSNYNAKDIDVGTLTINKATGGTLAAYNFQQKYTDLSAKTITPDYSDLPAGQTWTYSTPTPTTSGTAAVTGTSIGADTGVLSYTLTAGAKDDTVKWTVTISSHNYADFTKDVTLTLTDKDIPTVSANDITVTYDGSAIPDSKITGTATFNGSTVEGAWSFKSTAPTAVADSNDSVAVVFTPNDTTTYAVVETNIKVTINKATPTGTPTYTAITTSGKKLSDAALAIGSITPAGGSIAWDLGDTTDVTANTAYGWTYTPTPADAANYTTLTGTITPYVVSSSGGGSGSYTPSYTVSVDKTENGTITVSPKSASKGDTVTITVKPDKGYELEMLKALDKDGDALKLTEKNGKYTFKMPSGKVTVKGSFVEEAPVQIFKDVPVDAYYYEAVKWAAEKGITGGVGNGLFAPNQPCTRAQIVTFLWRAAGSPAPKSMSSFADVPADAFYAKAVAWAVENGITGGTGDGKFSPDATCTRAQSVTFLYRAAGSPKVSSSAEFGDVATNAYYADAVAWAAKNGITGGIGGGLFGSDNDCTRAQIVTFLYRSVK